MKKQYIIIGCLVLAVVLLVGTLLLLKDDIAGQPGEDETINLSITGYKQSEVREDVRRMTVHSTYGEMHFTPKPDENGYDSARWYIEEMNNAETGKWSANDIAVSFYAMTALKELSVTEADYANYGLDDPTVWVKLEYNDGTEYTYWFGCALALTEDGGGGYYLRRSGDPGVYLVENYYYENVNVALLDVLNNYLYEQIDSTMTVDKLTITGTNGFESLSYSYDEPNMTYYVTDPIYRRGDSTIISDIIGDIDEIAAEDIIAASLNPLPDEAMTMYGLDNPSRTLSFTYHYDKNVTDEAGKALTDEDGNAILETVSETITLRVGVVYDGLAYVMVDDRPVVYRVAYTGVDSWYDITPDKAVSRMIYYKRLVTMKSVTFITDFKTFKYDLDVTTSLNGVTLNGKKIETSVFQTLYTQFAAFQYSERGTAPEGQQPYMTVKAELISGEVDVIELIPSGTRRYEAKVNGEGGVLISYELVDALFEALKDSDKGTL